MPPRTLIWWAPHPIHSFRRLREPTKTVYAAPATQESLVPPGDTFVLKLNQSGSGVVWATYLGGKEADGATAAALDRSGNVWIVGTTASADFPNAQGWSQGADFVAELNSTGSALTYAARYPNGSVARSIAVDESGLVHVAGPDGLVSTLSSSGTTLSRIFGVANAAYGPVGGRTVPGEVISIYGPHIGPSTPVTATPDNTGAMPVSLAGVQVLAVGSGSGPYPLPLLYASDSQINAVIPTGGASGSALRIAQGAASPDFPVTAIPAEPEIFQNGDGSAAAVNQDGTINSVNHPAPVGSVVSVWVTGTGYYALGLAAPGSVAFGPRNTNCCAVTVNTSAAYVPYAGDAPGAVGGVVQINFYVPALPSYEIAEGVAAVTVQVCGVSSHEASIFVAQ